ncbi:Glycoside hydrolase family 2 immunoglobulin-like beta-sandwich [Penicillium taxi]|uniref:Glycoside hydrolase family 2 immunoglobulin-like beta-sandwich n=1 Tax=Penicillium taxi TaxID=168475 RepID=UPI0025453DB5|nr:Glycoside hydrolase family 2 immunoglobulin-like beta-sandwich [Penicillium taxi]KAJ5895666.1 Glycoside hydrolase family 2 immunoglobulin-like beta-sandwich [Penicillium taxi]
MIRSKVEVMWGISPTLVLYPFHFLFFPATLLFLNLYIMKLSSYPLDLGWSFRDLDSEEWMPVRKVPSVVQQDLIDNEKLKDPFIRFNELDAQWVNEKSWIYRKVIQKPNAPQGATVALVFDGLDTFATVKLDSKIVLTSANMFVGHRIDITRELEADGDHIIEVEFDCALLKARELRRDYPLHKWISFNGDPSRLAVRKAQYHWGWDWGPVLMTAGIWRAVHLEVYTARVSNLWPQVKVAPDHQSALVTAAAKVDTVVIGDYSARFRLVLRGIEIAHQDIPVSRESDTQVIFRINCPELWWPHGYGDQSLYEISVSLIHNNEAVDQVSKKFGIRSAVVVQQPDKHGRSFFFRINGMDIFCGGACWIPADSLLTNVSRDRYRKWIQLMVEGRQVMIRVWGGGIYEDDTFYETCDQLGVMVWQDFMFACGNYPTWPGFLESVHMEAVFNLHRLRHHPSIVIYVGNNEDYQVQETAGLTYNYEDKNPYHWLNTDFPARYIYEKLLPDLVAEHSPSTFYHPGSPWGDGKKTSDPTVGDLHQWNVWHGTQQKYQIFDTLGGRFNSEFGMESFPYLPTIQYFVENEQDLHPQSHVMDFHNKADGHERRLATYLVENVRLATELEKYIYLTQVVQAETMTFGYRGWRRQWGDDRHCGGALLWQLNDCWPTISWAIVDYLLHPKPAYYAVKRVLSPIAVGVKREHHDWSVTHAKPPQKSFYELWVASSRPYEVRGSIELRFLSIETGEEIRKAITQDVKILYNGTTEIISGTIDHVLYPEPHVLSARLWVDQNIVARDVDWPQPLKYLKFSDNLKIEFNRTRNQIHLLISARTPAKGLVFEATDGVLLSDNMMDIVPGDPQTVIASSVSADFSNFTLNYRFLGQEQTNCITFA